MSRHKPLDDAAKVVDEFGGLLNKKRTKDIGFKGLTIAQNVEITDTKKLVRRNGYALLDASVCKGVYGTAAQDRLYAVLNGNLMSIDADGVQTQLATGLVGNVFSWYEDPNNHVYYTSDLGSNGIITNDGRWLPLSLPIPDIVSAAIVDPGTWEVRPFNLGKKYVANSMQVMATCVMADGRESAPCETISIAVAPEVKLLRFTVTVPGALTRIYATAPGGSTYYLIAQATQPTVTVPVSMLNMTGSGVTYEEPLSGISFPADAHLLAFYDGALFAASYDRAVDQGVIYPSLPLRYHLFDPAEDFIAVSSYPLLLLPFVDGLIIGTSTNIYKYTPEHLKVSGQTSHEVLTEIADYGVVAGGCGDVHEGTAYFWTRRGIARAGLNERGQFQYELMTKDKVSLDPGVFAHAHLFQERGYIKLIASTVAGGTAFNAWPERG
jgi:hypothetical protein